MKFWLLIVLFFLLGCSVNQGSDSRHLAAALELKNSTNKTTDPAALAPSDLATLNAPVIHVRVPKTGVSFFATEIQAKNDLQIFRSKAGHSLTVRKGNLIATRGFGFDLLAKARDQGFVYHFADGNHQQKTLRVRCERSGPIPDQLVIAGTKFTVFRWVSDCDNDEHSFKNTYWQSKQGRVWKSREWVGPQIGHIEITRLN